ncbi:MAG: UDP-N-acetylmuramoyl-L-alanine--D-glutamate ligase [Flavobacteriales bacterium]|nr:UDP-N-acetylmuramoyl-L-alanine--D-glutamate ligase [Flavobacteriales bacterium]
MGKLVVLGSGESGMGAAKLARKHGWEVLVSDRNAITAERKEVLSRIGAQWEEGGHSEEVLLADEVVKSPGIPDDVEVVQSLLRASIPVISEIEFASRYTAAKIVGVTGTNGKTTTVNLIQHILQKAGMDSILAGNVGNSFAAELSVRDPEIWVLELSSFQLDGIRSFRPDVAILLNITPDHLDRYQGELDRYVDAKFRIAENQTPADYFIYCHDDPIIQQGFERNTISAHRIPFSMDMRMEEGAWVEEEDLTTLIHGKLNTMSIYKLALQGKHNLYNSMAAAMASRVLDVSSETLRESLEDFQGVEHRLEFVSKVNGIEYINDSKATNVNATWYALESMKNEVVWIVGGVDKGNDYKQLKDLVDEKVKAIICLGKDNAKIIKAFKKLVPVIHETTSALEAVKLSSLIAKKGDTVLLSPCCASFDLFESYEERGRMFKRAVRSL